MENNVNVKLLICYHKPDKLFKDDILTPIHVGRAQAKASGNKNLPWLTENMIGDDTGDNISDKNYCYNELTAPYWAWKNYGELGNPDYIGLMHYRRHFIFNESRDMGVVDYEGMNDYYADSIDYSRENVEKLLKDKDIVYYKGRVDNIYKHYCENHKKEDLDLALDILAELYPDYAQTARKYVQGDTGCFCNMAIFSKEMFFEYCEWLFPILERFFNQVDMSEKRFFISERLTGIFIAKKISEGKRVSSIASTFVHTEYRIPVVIPVDSKAVFETAVTVQSFVRNASLTTHIDFHLLLDGEESESAKAALEDIISVRPDFKINYVDLKGFLEENKLSFIMGKKELYPLVIGELCPGIGKCFYATGKVLIMKDIEEFFRICSVDDFWIVGAGEKNENGEIEWFGSSAVINARRFKDHGVMKLLIENYREDATPSELMEATCKDQYSVYPHWFWVNADEKDTLIPKEAKRGELQRDATWHTMICYKDETHPAINIQSLYSNFWWNIAGTMHSAIPFDIDTATAIENLDKDQMILNTFKNKDANAINPPSNDLSMYKKAKRYYKQFGFKATIRRCFEKLSGR